ncbi:uncharacterized protein SPPG_02854 [Spizellomyces punctatus DAOM BR117]|uniref:Dienelactone hydrolase domain-containing protein n=1 Tax=Spizellomyces punctatus (strain DAOM BR117) TaxID=645134 RepID=A0A0L0HN72_SPIPD|nr:uncharacterized protein SPPG_02854 [Spizellomyces punctatus DAOM BR117]KND02385.1 hypothetical protein SPPG_02854 [Spizellomyces punctatus DAOM BR117]|eukprot:XP_016610424.1 hypothetical protein SPPG_02854 [Spizellomyces punctatus DAOM BR117]
MPFLQTPFRVLRGLHARAPLLNPALKGRWFSAGSRLHKSSLPVLEFQPQGEVEHDLNTEGSFVPEPVIIVLQEWWGINEQIKAHAQHLANDTGAIAIVPDLYRGKQALDAAEAAHLRDELDWPGAIDELSKLVKDLRKDGKRKIGSIGFCMGGALSLALAASIGPTKNPGPLNACVSFYGIPPLSLIDITPIPLYTPVQLHIGEKDNKKGFSDPETARAVQRKWEEVIRQHGGRHAEGFHKLEASVFFYPGQGHAFMNDLPWSLQQRKELGYEGGFDKDLVNLAWRRVTNFFIEHLKTL